MIMPNYNDEYHNMDCILIAEIKFAQIYNAYIIHIMVYIYD